MTFKGSIVVKKIHLLGEIESQKTMFRSNISEDAKSHIWGRQIAYENLLRGEISDNDWDYFMTNYCFNIHNNMGMPGARVIFQGLDLLFDISSEIKPKPTPKETIKAVEKWMEEEWDNMNIAYEQDLTGQRHPRWRLRQILEGE